MTFQLRYRWIAVLVALLLVTVGVTSVVAAADQSSTDSAVQQIGRQEIVISDAHVTVSDIHVSGPGLPAIDIHERTYTIQDVSMTTDGLMITYNGQPYEICSVSIALDDFSVTLENIHIGPSN
jgi:hypothetical protein